jgi:putative phosphoribosyl transferase
MHPIVVNAQLQGRKEAGLLLARKLAAYRHTNAVVVGIPHGGVCVASVIAEELSLPLEVMPCRRIKHPAESQQYIGSVSENEVVLHDCSRTIPQDYLSHQIILLKNAILHENRKYYDHRKRDSFLYKTVILVDDILISSDGVIACLREIKREKPLNLVVAIPVVSAEAARIVQSEADDLVFLHMENSISSPHNHFVHFPAVDDSKVKELLTISKKKFLHA